MSEKTFKTVYRYLIIIFYIVIAILAAFLILRTPILLKLSLVLILALAVLNYCLSLIHVTKYYLGDKQDLWFKILLIDIIGPAHIYYHIKHVRYYLESRYRYAYSREITKRKLKDLKVYVFTGNKDNKGEYEKIAVSITESPVYKYLLSEDEGIFVSYHDNIVRKKRHNYSYSLEKFNKLRKGIEEKGYDGKQFPLRIMENVISDGQHRACIAYFLYGPEYEAEVIERKV